MDHRQVQIWYEQYKLGLFRFCLSIMKDTHRAEDVLQELFVRLLSGKYTPEPGKEQAYLYRTARNLCFDELRREKRQGELTEHKHSAPDSLAYLELIAPLTRKEQEIVSLRIIGGLTHKEIGKILRLTEQAAKKRYERAIRKLKEE